MTGILSLCIRNAPPLIDIHFCPRKFTVSASVISCKIKHRLHLQKTSYAEIRRAFHFISTINSSFGHRSYVMTIKTFVLKIRIAVTVWFQVTALYLDTESYYCTVKLSLNTPGQFHERNWVGRAIDFSGFWKLNSYI